MPDREAEKTEAGVETSVEPPAPAQEPAKTEFQEGALPEVAAVATPAAAATASQQAFDEPTKDTSHLDTGVHHWEDYKAACEAAGATDKWKPEYRFGHTAAHQWKQPHDKKKDNDFELKHGRSASEAIQAWLKGPTIADYRAIGVAVELDELRDELGNQKFDKLFGSTVGAEDAAIPHGQRLHIAPGLYSIPLIDQMKEIARQHDEAETKGPEDVAPTPVVEARVEEKPKAAPEEQEPLVVAQELGLEQQDRELV